MRVGPMTASEPITSLPTRAGAPMSTKLLRSGSVFQAHDHAHRLLPRVQVGRKQLDDALLLFQRGQQLLQALVVVAR